MDYFADPSEKVEISTIRHEIRELYKNLDTSQYIKLPLTQKLFAVVDDIFIKDIRKYHWMAQATNSGVYAFAQVNGERYYLQRFIYELMINFRRKKPKKHKQVTFKNKLSLDCRLENLVGFDRTSILQNKRPKIQVGSGQLPTSKFKGVCKKSADTMYSVSIKDRNDRYYLGRHKDEEYAAKVYDNAVKELIGRTGYLNFPDNEEEEPRRVALRYIKLRKKRQKEKQANLTNTKVS